MHYELTRREGERVPVLVWAKGLESGAEEQARHLASLPVTARPVALMADCHRGYGMPIGGVLATQDAVIPNAVGVDIGCGVASVMTSLTAEQCSRDVLTSIVGRIRELVPVGFGHHTQPQTCDWKPGGDEGARELERARHQVGTLGGGNHFIELQADEQGCVWVMVHTGSRNVGYRVAQAYAAQAKALASPEVAAWDLAWLSMSEPIGRAYWDEMRACVAFARMNRQAITERVLSAVWTQAGGRQMSDEIDVAHNYAAREPDEDGDAVIVHRKGATSARLGEIGLVPGSQGTHSYIVRGRGESLSLQSCSHGAGRRMGRKQAQRELSVEAEVAALEAQGIVHAIRGVRDLDEAPGAYKSIEEVMAQQADLVDVVARLRPLAVVKG